jgi:glycosyltransferase involved in cell wall biosynthesis
LKRALKILQVASAMPRWAGTEKHVLDLTCELRRLGHNVAIGCQADSEIELRAGRSGVRTVPLEMRSTHDWRQLPKFMAAMRNHVDVVHIHHNMDYIVPAAAARLAGVPAVIMTRHLPHRFSSGLKAFACGEIFYDVIIAVSDAIRRTLIDCGIDRKRIRLVRNGIDFSKAAGADGKAFRASLNLPTEAFLVAAAGRIEHAKGFHILIKAVKIARERGMPIFAVIAGEGSQYDELQTLCNELGLQDCVKLPGFRTDVLNIIAAADVGVVPSIWADPFPYAVLEVMACSKPIVASLAGGIPEMVSERSAVLVAPGNPEALAEALVSLARNPNRCAQIGQEAFREVQSFTIPALAANVEAVYWDTMNRATQPRESFAHAGD